jgi:hypothetical protein
MAFGWRYLFDCNLVVACYVVMTICRCCWLVLQSISLGKGGIAHAGTHSR